MGIYLSYLIITHTHTHDWWVVISYHKHDCGPISWCFITSDDVIIERFIIVRFIIVRFIIVRFIIVRFIIVRFIIVRFIIVRFIIVVYIIGQVVNGTNCCVKGENSSLTWQQVFSAVQGHCTARFLWCHYWTAWVHHLSCQ